MEQSHMPAVHMSPEAQAGADLGQPGVATPQSANPIASPLDASTTMQTSPGPRDHEHKLSGDFSSHINASLSLQLPPLALSFPDDRTTELPPIKPRHERPSGPAAQTLPPLSSVTGAQTHTPIPKPPEPSHPAPYTSTKPPTNHWPSLNPFTTYYTPSHLDPVESSPSRCSDRDASHRGRSVTLDDPDVRIAAEALGQMKTDWSSSRNQSTSLASTPSDRKPSRDYKRTSLSSNNNGHQQTDPEPLLSLITTSHPLLATAVEGAASVYTGGKNYSPHIKTGAEYVESCLKPVSKAVGNVGRKTGVEGGVRWIFGMRSRKQHSSTDIETSERGNSKRRKSDRPIKGQTALNGPSSQDLGPDGEDRRMSISTVDTLPAYDDQKSPAYTEMADDKLASRPGSGSPGEQQWGQRFVVTTSGLGVAMKQESLKSLRYCLKVVKDTNGYIGEVLVKLKSVIEEYDMASQHDGEDHVMADGNTRTRHTAEDRNRLILRMSELRDDLFRVIHRTVQTISKYAGGALPENARDLVHRQLMSLPSLYRFHYLREAEGQRENASPEAWARDSAHLALLFAKEAVHMMSQVGDVLSRTLVSAEEWCDTLYRKRNEQSQSPLGTAVSLPATPHVVVDHDINMSG